MPIQGYIFRYENDIYSPPFWKWYFFPLSRHIIFWLPSWPFCLNSTLFCIYFTFLVPLFSFSFPLIPFSFPILPFSFTFYPFFSSPYHIFSPYDMAEYPRGGIFQYIDPCAYQHRSVETLAAPPIYVHTYISIQLLRVAAKYSICVVDRARACDVTARSPN